MRSVYYDRKPYICASLTGQDGWILAEFLLRTETFPQKHKNKTRLISSHLDRTSLINKAFIILEKRFRFHKNQEWLVSDLRERGKKANCVCNTINTRGSFSFSLFLPLFTPSSPVFSERYELCESAPRTFFQRGIIAGNSEPARWTG